VRKVDKALRKKGMRRDRDGHHVMYRLELQGVMTLVTRISHGADEIDNHLAGLMARQCALRHSEFFDLVDCPLSAKDWHKLVEERCAGGRNPMLG